MWHRLKLSIAGLAFIGLGLWFGLDGFYRWPRQNELAIQQKQDPRHSPTDIGLQRGLAFVLPPVGIYLLARLIRRSRGEFRLEDGILHVPGHPPIPLDCIVYPINKRRWERKGIAEIEYKLPGSEQTGTFELDDFYFERQPTDAIFEQIEAGEPAEEEEEAEQP